MGLGFFQKCKFFVNYMKKLDEAIFYVRNLFFLLWLE